jgi:4-hydroxybenzoate polyprenyltransferase
MLTSNLWYAVQQAFLPVVVAVALSASAVYLIARFIGKLRASGQLIFLLALSSLGGFLGYSAGASRQSIIGTVLPTLLTLVTLLLGYVFSKKSVPELQPLIPYCILLLVLNAFWGLFVGSEIRARSEDFERDYNRRMLYYERVELEVEKAEKLKKVEANAKQ